MMYDGNEPFFYSPFFFPFVFVSKFPMYNIFFFFFPNYLLFIVDTNNLHNSAVDVEKPF